MLKNQISCRKCNEKFKSMLDFVNHICPNEKTAPKWSSTIGRIGRRSSSEYHAQKQILEKYWLLQAEKQRKKNKDKLKRNRAE